MVLLYGFLGILMPFVAHCGGAQELTEFVSVELALSQLAELLKESLTKFRHLNLNTFRSSLETCFSSKFSTRSLFCFRGFSMVSYLGFYRILGWGLPLASPELFLLEPGARSRLLLKPALTGANGALLWNGAPPLYAKFVSISNFFLCSFPGYFAQESSK